ncbi:MAG: hypothetical protein V7629_13810 [Motiliproteus sp.]
MKTPDAVVALTGFGGLEAHQPGAAVARALRDGWQANISIEALGYDSVMTAAWMPGVADRLHLIPAIGASDDAVLEQILRIHEKTHLDALLPCLNNEVALISRLSERLARAGIHTLLPRPDRIDIIHKPHLPKFFFEHQLLAPSTRHLAEPNDILLHAEQFGFPLLMRGIYSGVKVVYTPEQARFEALRLDAGRGEGVLLQAMIYGDQFSVALVADRDGEASGMVIMRQLAANENGLMVCGTVVDDPEIDKTVRRILKKLDWRGPLELDLVRPQGCNELYLRDINAHFPCWIRLSHWANCNLPALLLSEILLCTKKTPQKAQPGPIILHGISETLVPLADVLSLHRRQSVAGPATNGRLRDNICSTGLRVAVTGISSFDVVNPGIGVARALRLAPEVSQVYGLCYGNFDSGSYDPDLFDAVCTLPAYNDAEAILERLRTLYLSHPFDVVIPCIDDEIPYFIQIKDELTQMGVRTLLPSLEAFERRSKPVLFGPKTRADWGAFEIPESHVVRSEAEVTRALEAVGLPAAIKGPICQCIAVNSAAEARAAWLRLRSYGNTEAIIQPLIAGPVFAVACVCDPQHRALSMLSVKKLARCERGSTWSALHIAQPELEASFGEMLCELEWVGPVEGEFIRDEIRDRFYLIEINPRFTGWIFYSAGLGSNHPGVAVRTAMGESTEAVSNNPNLVFMRSSSEILVRPTTLAALTIKGVIRHA